MKKHWSLKHLFPTKPPLVSQPQPQATQATQATQKPTQKPNKKKSPKHPSQSPPLTPDPKSPKRRKATIPVAFREQIWIRDCGKVFEAKCPTPWCQNRITVFDFQSGHNIPESKGGPTKPENLLPLCSRCNQSMGDRYTFDEWSALAPAAAKQQQAKQQQQAQDTPPLTQSVGVAVAVAPPPRNGWCC